MVCRCVAAGCSHTNKDGVSLYKFPKDSGLKGNCSGKKIIFFIPSIDRVCGSDAQEKKSDFLHGSVRKYKTLRSSTNCGCGHLMTHFVGIAITQQFIVVHSKNSHVTMT